MKIQAAALVSLTGLVAAQNTTLHTVIVGTNGLLRFNPDTVYAKVGELVRFEYYPVNHSVVQGSYEKPCQPLTNGFYSGYVPSGSGRAPTVFDITINDTNPIYYYCSQGPHCELGMVGVINPPADGSNSQADYALAASNVMKSADQPNGVEGGRLVVLSNATTTTVTSTVGITATSIPSSAASATGTATGTGVSAGSGGATTTSAGGSASGTATGSAASTSSSTAAAVTMEKRNVWATFAVVIGLGINLL